MNKLLLVWVSAYCIPSLFTELVCRYICRRELQMQNNHKNSENHSWKYVNTYLLIQVHKKMLIIDLTIF
jgi:hypothetical protein